MVERKAVGLRVLADVMQAQWMRLGDQDPEDAVAQRKTADGRMRRLVDANLDDRRERLERFLTHTEGRVPGARQLRDEDDASVETHGGCCGKAVGMQGRGRRPSAAHGAGDRCGRAHGGARALTWRRDAGPPSPPGTAPRRVVTAHDERGRSVVISDGPLRGRTAFRTRRSTSSGTRQRCLRRSGEPSLVSPRTDR